MPYFFVFQINDRDTSAPPGTPDRDRLATFVSTVAVFHASSGEEACRAAAAKTKNLRTYFAVEGTPWGVDMLQVEGVVELGAEPPQETELERRTRELERRVLERDVPLD